MNDDAERRADYWRIVADAQVTGYEAMLSRLVGERDQARAERDAADAQAVRLVAEVEWSKERDRDAAERFMADGKTINDLHERLRRADYWRIVAEEALAEVERMRSAGAPATVAPEIQEAIQKAIKEAMMQIIETSRREA